MTFAWFLFTICSQSRIISFRALIEAYAFIKCFMSNVSTLGSTTVFLQRVCSTNGEPRARVYG